MKSKTLNAQLKQDLSPGDEPAKICLTGEIGEDFHYWRGDSGNRYLHSVFALVDCPEISKANYILVNCDQHGARRALDIGQLAEGPNSLNLAQLRQRGAMIGANEIHIHILTDTAADRDAVERDLRRRHLPNRRLKDKLARAG